MASAGADWQTNPETQIRWMIGYTDQTYGSPCAAWAHEQAVGSYERETMGHHGTAHRS